MSAPSTNPKREQAVERIITMIEGDRVLDPNQTEQDVKSVLTEVGILTDLTEVVVNSGGVFAAPTAVGTVSIRRKLHLSTNVSGFLGYDGAAAIDDAQRVRDRYLEDDGWPFAATGRFEPVPL